METPNEQEYHRCKIFLAPSHTEAGSWTCGWTVREGRQQLMTGYVHGPFTTSERAKRAALREAKEAVEHRMKPRSPTV